MKLSLSKIFLIFLSVPLSSFRKDLVFSGQDYPPMNWQQDSEVTGGMTDIMKHICSSLKKKCIFTLAPVARVMKMIEDGEIDGGISFFALPDREKFAYFSVPIILTHISYLGIAQTPKINNLKSLDGWNVAVVRGSAMEKLVMKHKEEVKTINIIEEVDTETLIKKLTAGRYSLKTMAIGSEDVLQHIANKLSSKLETRLKLEDQLLKVAFSKKAFTSKDLALFNEAILKAKSDGTIKKILDKYQLRMAN